MDLLEFEVPVHPTRQHFTPYDHYEQVARTRLEYAALRADLFALLFYALRLPMQASLDMADGMGGGIHKHFETRVLAGPLATTYTLLLDEMRANIRERDYHHEKGTALELLWSRNQKAVY